MTLKQTIIHIKNNGRAWCGVHGSPALTDNPKEVSCRRCLQLIKQMSDARYEIRGK